MEASALQRNCRLLATLGIFVAALVAFAPETWAQGGMNSDASQMISNSGILINAFQQFLLALIRLPHALVRGVLWVGSWNDWGGILLCSAASICAGEIGSRVVFWLTHRSEAKTGLGHLAKFIVVCGAFFLAGLIVLALLPRWPKVHGVSTVLFIIWGTVVTFGSGARQIFQAVGLGTDGMVRRIELAVAIAGLSYLALGLIRLGSSEDTTAIRQVGGLIFWVAFLLVSGSIISRFHALSNTWADGVTTQSDPISLLLLKHTSVFFGTMLVFLGSFVVVSAYTTGPEAFFRGFVSIGLLGALPGIVAILPFLVNSNGSEERLWRQTFVHCARLFIFIGFWIVLAILWDINPFAAASDKFGQSAARVLVDVSIATALAYMLWDIARTALDQFAQPKRALLPGEADEGGVRTATRIQTFVPLVRAVALIFIISATVMIVLASMGVNIGPLLAGAGIVGVAVGFGSQALVKDIISGIFFLADDAFRLGEYIEIGTAKGTVEGISIRSLKMRHPRGALYTVPFGEMRMVNNQSRDFVIVKLEFTVPFDTDLMKAKKAVKAVSAEVEADEELAHNLLQPVKFQGVRRMEQYGIVVGVKFTAKPMEQWVLRREVFARVRDKFSSVGIDFARPQVMVQVPEGEHWNEHQLSAAQAAATTVVQKQKADEEAAQEEEK